MKRFYFLLVTLSVFFSLKANAIDFIVDKGVVKTRDRDVQLPISKVEIMALPESICTEYGDNTDYEPPCLRSETSCRLEIRVRNSNLLGLDEIYIIPESSPAFPGLTCESLKNGWLEDHKNFQVHYTLHEEVTAKVVKPSPYNPREQDCTEYFWLTGKAIFQNDPHIYNMERDFNNLGASDELDPSSKQCRR